MLPPFNAALACWKASDGRIFSAEAAAIVAATDKAYLDAEAAGMVTTWPYDDAGAQTDAALSAQLALYGLAFPDAKLEADDLIAYANSRQMSLALGGFLAVINGKPVPFSTSMDGLTLMNGKVSRLQQPNPPSVVNWQVGATSFVAIAPADFMTAAIKVGDFVQATFDALPAIFSAIAAGTITTRAQIDSATWPTPGG